MFAVLAGRTANTGSSMNMKKDVIIIGAGAAGLLCAAECGKRGRSVLVIDHAERTGSKIRVSGGGRCNFTNLNVTPDHYLSRNAHFCRSALARFVPRDILSLAEKHHIAYYEKEAGQMFCVKSSREIITALERECGQAGVEIRLPCHVSDISHARVFTVTTSEGVFSSDSLVIATGGLSYSKLGASGFGYDVARKFKLKVTQVRPALVPFVFQSRDQKIFKGLAGIAFDTTVSTGRKKFRGNILFTHRGLSGPAVLQASLYWEPGQSVLIDLLPELNLQGVFLSARQSRMGMHTLLAGYLPRRFVQTWCDHKIISKPINQYTDKELEETAAGLHAWEIIPKGTEGYDVAEVTAGGVNTDELSSKTMEARKRPGLYFIGEVVDVTGMLGGYNLHWAWASGHAAGQFA
jgi:predicted Rossmann fold flavoprotein